MEQWFDKKQVRCLRRSLRQTQEREQTQEVRLSDGMPDVGAVICVRGQCVLRSKEWRSDSVGASGGVMVWIVYEPADGTQPQVVESWIPIQVDMDLRDSVREGSLCVSFCLRNLDARSTSPRKLMVRANVSVLMEALEPWEAEVFVPGTVQPEFQLLRKTYPFVLPVEAGEKSFEIVQTLSLPSGMPMPERILSLELIPKLSERKILGGKAVFRGNGMLRMCYQSADGMVRWAELEAPFSQYSDLEQDHEQEASLSAVVAVTGMDAELAEDAVHLNCKMVAQFVVWERVLMELVEDAYSLRNQVQLHTQGLELPAVLEQTVEDIRMSLDMKAEAAEVLDVWCYGAQPSVRRAGDLNEIQLGGTVGVLYRDGEGRVRGMNTGWNQTLERRVGEDAVIFGAMDSMERPSVTMKGDALELRLNFPLRTDTVMHQPLEMVAGVEVGEAVEREPGRPSLILRRARGDSLWELAKNSGSTVEAIRKANGLTEEPAEGRMLLIPVS